MGTNETETPAWELSQRTPKEELQEYSRRLGEVSTNIVNDRDELGSAAMGIALQAQDPTLGAEIRAFGTSIYEMVRPAEISDAQQKLQGYVDQLLQDLETSQ